MSENFSKNFENTFRIFFICWVSFWAVINTVNLLVSYAVFERANTSNQIAAWGLDTFGQILTITFGIVLFCMMIGVPSRINALKKITNITTMTVLAVFYYLLFTLIKTFSLAMFKPENFAKDFIFQMLWLLPSIIILVFHMLYFANLRKHNEEIELKKVSLDSPLKA